MNQNEKRLWISKLISENSDTVYSLCLSLTYSREDADDLFQETFLKIYENISKFQESDNEKQFVLSQTVFIWKSWKRKYARRQRLAPIVSVEEANELPDEICIDEVVINNDQSKNVQSIVAKLNEKLRITVILYYSLQMDIAEISNILKIPEGTVKSRLYKARNTIREELEGQENE